MTAFAGLTTDVLKARLGVCEYNARWLASRPGDSNAMEARRFREMAQTWRVMLRTIEEASRGNA